MALRWLALLLPLVGVGCFSPSHPDCAFRCTANNNYNCPPDFTCDRTENFCKRKGFTGACPFSRSEGGIMAADGAAGDLGAISDLSGRPDLASRDLLPGDAPPADSGAPDLVAPDAGLPDASLPDGEMPDGAEGG